MQILCHPVVRANIPTLPSSQRLATEHTVSHTLKWTGPSMSASFPTFRNQVQPVCRASLSHPLQGCYYSFKSTASMNTCLSTVKRGGRASGRREQWDRLQRLWSLWICLSLQSWSLPQGVVSQSICLGLSKFPLNSFFHLWVFYCVFAQGLS